MCPTYQSVVSIKGSSEQNCHLVRDWFSFSGELGTPETDVSSHVTPSPPCHPQPCWAPRPPRPAVLLPTPGPSPISAGPSSQPWASTVTPPLRGPVRALPRPRPARLHPAGRTQLPHPALCLQIPPWGGEAGSLLLTLTPPSQTSAWSLTLAPACIWSCLVT